MQKTLFTLITILSFCITYGQNIDIGLFYGKNISTFTFTPMEGKYDILHKDAIIDELKKDEIAYITVINGYIQLRKTDNLIGTYKTISFNGKTKENYFSIKPVWPSLDSRIYDDNLSVRVIDSTLQIINHVDLEKYIAGVVESESGSTSEIEFYKSQALICRTYAYKNINRHYDENFNLCDGVHCQAYKSKSFYTKLIPKAAFATKSLIIVDSSFAPIDAAFHANSGGQTANSEEVWLSEKYYLRSIDDPYSLKGNSIEWTKQISLEEWIKYLKNYNFDIPVEYPSNYFNFQQPKRINYYKIENDSIAFKKIRADFNLRSSYFSVKSDSSNIIFEGKGYGHGVGLSQEGGMEMAKQGKSFEDIIYYYYKGVRIISYKELKKNLE